MGNVYKLFGKKFKMKLYFINWYV